MPLPIAEWLKSLDEMETTLAATVSTLDDYERNWGQHLEATPLEAPSHEPSYLQRLEERLGEWDSRLLAAADLAASVEHELNDRQAVIGRWQELFNGWRGSIEQSPTPAVVTS